jgi:hypothetical protein
VAAQAEHAAGRQVAADQVAARGRQRVEQVLRTQLEPAMHPGFSAADPDQSRAVDLAARRGSGGQSERKRSRPAPSLLPSATEASAITRE